MTGDGYPEWVCNDQYWVPPEGGDYDDNRALILEGFPIPSAPAMRRRGPPRANPSEKGPVREVRQASASPSSSFHPYGQSGAPQ